MSAESIMAIASVTNLILIIVFSVTNYKFQTKINQDNKSFQSNLYNLSFNSYWMHEIIFKEFRQSLSNFEIQSTNLINETNDQEIFPQFTPILKSFMEDLRFFDILSKDLKNQIKDLVTDLEDIITDTSIAEKKRCMEMRKTKINIINLIYKYDCNLHKIN